MIRPLPGRCKRCGARVILLALEWCDPITGERHVCEEQAA